MGAEGGDSHPPGQLSASEGEIQHQLELEDDEEAGLLLRRPTLAHKPALQFPWWICPLLCAALIAVSSAGAQIGLKGRLLSICDQTPAP